MELNDKNRDREAGNYVETKVVSAQIYHSGAMLCRRGKVRLFAGDQRFYIVGLGSTTKARSLRLKFDSNGSLRHCRVSEVEPLSSSLRSSGQKQLEELEKEEQMLREKIAAWEAAKEAWKVNSDFTGRGSVSLEQGIRYIEELPERLLAIDERIRDLEDRAADCVRRKERIKDAVQKTAQRLRYGVAVDVFACEEGVYSFEVSYIETRASWITRYELRMENTASPLKLGMRAQVAQYTGEDWENTALTLFYGNMHQSNDMPKLKPWRLGFGKPYSLGAARPGVAAAMQDPTTIRHGETMVVAPVGDAEAVSGLTGSAPFEAAQAVPDVLMRYDLSGFFDLRDQIQGTMIDLMSFSLEAQYLYRAVPSRDGSAFLTAYVGNLDQYGLLPGMAELFIENTYIGSVFVSGVTGEDGMEIPLGRERRIETERKLQRKYHSLARFKNTQVENYEYEITVTNKKQEPVNLEVLDQIPVSGDREITVQIQELSGASVSQTDGIVTWKLMLAPEQTQVLRLAYSVTWPKNRTLSRPVAADRAIASVGAAAPPVGAAAPVGSAPVLADEDTVTASADKTGSTGTSGSAGSAGKIPSYQMCSCCGAIVETDLVFCPQCGEKLS